MTDSDPHVVKIVAVEREHMADVVALLDDQLTRYLPDPDLYDQIWQAFSAQDNVRAVVAVEGDTVVGYGSMVLEMKIRGGTAAYLEDIVVAPAYQGRKIGSAICRHLEGIARDLGCYKLALACKPEKDGFYRNLGYDRHGRSMVKALT